MRLLRGRFIGIVIVGMGVAAGAFASWTCTTYSNSRIAYIQGQNVCAYTGTGCTECVGPNGESCVTNGTSCETCGMMGYPPCDQT